MKIIINSKVLSLPPYLSTNWENISSLHVEERGHHRILVVFLNSGLQIKIPGLDNQLLDLIFTKHAQFLNQGSQPTSQKSSGLNAESIFLSPLRLAEGSLDILSSLMHHNPDHRNAPLLPKEILDKITQIFKVLPREELRQLPKAEPHCNCFYCQIARSVMEPVEERVEEVSDADLRFKEWDIQQKDKNLYLVTNPLDKSNVFQVFLGDSIGCTCGQKNCEHIEAVLRS